MTGPISPRLKTLEALVRETTLRLKKLTEENRKYKLANDELQEEHGKLESQLKRLQHFGQRQARIKSKIERIVSKLDKVGL